MNRVVVFGLAILFATVGIALLGGEREVAAAGKGCHGCSGRPVRVAVLNKCSGSKSCQGQRDCCGLFSCFRRRSCHGSCKGNSCKGVVPLPRHASQKSGGATQKGGAAQKGGGGGADGGVPEAPRTDVPEAPAEARVRIKGVRPLALNLIRYRR